MWDQRFQRKDTFASILKPDDIPADLVPTKVTGDGNCLFNSASINLVGNEDLSVILRLLTAAELYLHANFYANHPRYNQPDMTMSEASKLMVSFVRGYFGRAGQACCIKATSHVDVQEQAMGRACRDDGALDSYKEYCVFSVP
ncbi:hypothetical protein OS493_019363 [Desmophyllum pertusum]|uniref:OTU domain-containing protein n=1 Tax=Desmophyllum pertusum TaxID=174260 RepID=A0A9X0A0Q1_9CNID|nr:hypothetical protein OS493_019363 [Desmophyllum pertusum]